MTIELSVPLDQSSYLRTFDAEIDVLTDNEIVVRGVMCDHRFAFEHAWKLRTPEYEILEAGAKQIAGDPAEFDPALCERYADIKGVQIGRGFSKRVISALGDLPGGREHLFLAIEMARVGQQVYQFPQGFEDQFPRHSSNASESAHISWLKDRAYMPDLANSCYTYRDESTELFAARDVRCGFGDDLYRPKPGDKRVFWRNKSLSIELQTNGYSCESAMEDSIHDIRIGFDLSSRGVISNAASRGTRLPYHGICEDPHLRTAGLNGMQVTGRFVQQFAEHVGGAQGCTHLFDLSIDVLRQFKFGG
jgi:hypothetical protein